MNKITSTLFIILLLGMFLTGCNTQNDTNIVENPNIQETNSEVNQEKIVQTEDVSISDKKTNDESKSAVKLIKTFRIPDQYKPIHSSLSNKLETVLISDTDGNLHILNGENTHTKKFDDGGEFYNLVSPDGVYYLSVSGDGIALYSTQNDSIIFSPRYSVQFYDDVISSADFSDNSNFLVFGNNDGQLFVYKNEKEIWNKKIGGSWDHLVISSNEEKLLAITENLGDATIYLFDLDSGNVLSEFDYSDNSEYVNLIYSSGITSETIYICQDNLMKFFDYSGNLIKQEKSYFGCFQSYDEKTTITFPSEDTLKLNKNGEIKTRTIPEDLYQNIAFSENGKYLASYNVVWDRDVRIFEVLD